MTIEMNTSKLIALNFYIRICKIEILSTMLEDSLAWVDFLILGVVLLLTDDGDKLPALLVLVIFFICGLVTCSDLVR